MARWLSACVALLAPALMAAGSGLPAPCVPADPRPPLPIALLVVAMPQEFPTLRRSLHSWQRGGLLGRVAERLFWLQGQASAISAFMQARCFHVFGGRNVHVGLGFANLIPHATASFALILEKDWVLVAPPADVDAQLTEGLHLLRDGAADVVRYRSHREPGYPLMVPAIVRSRNATHYPALHPQRYLLCNYFHWFEFAELRTRFPAEFRPCGSAGGALCVDSEWCNWSNNPALFAVAFWNRHIADVARRCMGHPSNMCMETMLDTNYGLWRQRHFHVGFVQGLFKHEDPLKYGNATGPEDVFVTSLPRPLKRLRRWSPT
eukprot:EG_transcript_15400